MGSDEVDQCGDGEPDPGEVLFPKASDQEANPGKGTECKLKIVSWNINGMKTLNMQDVLKQLDCSILAVQETKLTRKQLDQSQVIPPGFSFSNNRIGYSGVATFCNSDWSSMKAEEGLCMPTGEEVKDIGGYPELSDEEETHVKFANADGRTVIIQNLVMLPDGTQRPLTVINVYCPRLRDDPEDEINNTEFKMTFHDILHRRAKQLVEMGSFVVIAGDISISHRWIDHCDGDPKTFVATEFRKLLDGLLSDRFVDSFRLLHPAQESAFTCWNTRLNARENNYGTRIDYIFIDKLLSSYLEKAEIRPDVFGSDHCPISATFHSLRPIPSETLPPFATKYYPEFKGRQKNLKELFLQAPSKSTGCESVGKKRPLEDAATISGKAQSAKRVQLSLRSFFTKNSKDETDSNSLACAELNQELLFKSQESSSSQETKSQSKQGNNLTDAWKKLLKAPEVPLCKGHQEPCTRRTVKKKGANFGREFYSCSHGVGKSDDPNANCNFFQWVKSTGTGPKNEK